MNVSIIIPCYNQASTLERAVISALQQPRVSEVIVVDDASSDDSATVARSLAGRDDRVRVCIRAANQGPAAARNWGAAQSTSGYIAFLDADDELIGEFIATAMQIFRENPEMTVVKCEMEFFDPIKGYILPAADPRHQAAVLSSSCGMLMRKDCFSAIGGFPEDAIFCGPAGGEDVAFMQAVMAHFQPIARIEQPGYRVWSRAGSHVDLFLAGTRLTADVSGFEFMDERASQDHADGLAAALDRYLSIVQSNILSAPVMVRL